MKNYLSNIDLQGEIFAIIRKEVYDSDQRARLLKFVTNKYPMEGEIINDTQMMCTGLLECIFDLPSWHPASTPLYKLHRRCYEKIMAWKDESENE